MGLPLSLSDLNEIDRHYWPSLCHIRDCKDAEEEDLTLSQLDLPFTTASASGHEVVLTQQHRRVTHDNRDQYLQLALNYRLHEFDAQIKAVRRGLGQVVPLPLLSLFTGPELEAMVCGSPEIPLALLKSVTTYKGVEAHCGLVRWFWEVMDEYSHVERSLFLRFVWGRTRLPRTLADFRGRDFVLQVLTYSLTLLLTYLLTYLLIYIFTYLLTYSLTYLLTCLLTYLFSYFLLIK